MCVAVGLGAWKQRGGGGEALRGRARNRPHRVHIVGFRGNCGKCCTSGNPCLVVSHDFFSCSHSGGYTKKRGALAASILRTTSTHRRIVFTLHVYGSLWYLQVPSEAFRLGKTRVFFRAGQISTLQKILNETPPEKGPWIFSRLQEALASRQKAKAAAAEAQVGASRAQTHRVYVVTQCSSELTIFFICFDASQVYRDT